MASSIDALFLGSVPLPSNEEVFTTLSTALGSTLSRIPDGETGFRDHFIICQLPVLPDAAKQARWGGHPSDQPTLNTKLSDLNPIGYDDWAITSFKTFSSLQKAGKIPPTTRFQVCLPTSFGVVQGFVEKNFCAEIEPLYEHKFLDAIKHIQASIPHDKLALQFDLPWEIAALEFAAGRLVDDSWKAWFAPAQQGMLKRLARLVVAVEPDVPLGFHLCYGDIGHAHFIEPLDAALMVEFANGIATAVGPSRSIDYVHIPVPKGRTDEAYFAPLRGLRLGAGTKLYLGVVHADDLQGSRERLEVARRFYTGLVGVASECGLGRTPGGELESILQITRELTSMSMSNGAA